MIRQLPCAFALAVAFTATAAQPVSAQVETQQQAAPAERPARLAKVSISPPYMLVGDRVTATLAVPLVDGDAEPVFPDWSRGWGEAEVLEAGPVQLEGAGSERSAVQKLVLTAFKTGSVSLPSVEIRLGAHAAAATPASLALEVRTVLAADDKELKPAPPAPPRPQPLSRRVLWALAGAGLAALAAGILAYRRRYDRDPLAAPALAPFAELTRALGMLAERSPADAFRGLSHAFRRYLGRAFDFHALESTTTEIQRRLAERGLERDAVRQAIATLRLADQVKFARRPAGPDEAHEKIEATRALATTIEALLAPPEIAAGDVANAAPKKESAA